MSASGLCNRCHGDELSVNPLSLRGTQSFGVNGWALIIQQSTQTNGTSAAAQRAQRPHRGPFRQVTSTVDGRSNTFSMHDITSINAWCLLSEPYLSAKCIYLRYNPETGITRTRFLLLTLFQFQQRSSQSSLSGAFERVLAEPPTVSSLMRSRSRQKLPSPNI